MSRILITTVPVAGHVAPIIPLCRELVARGHDVAWYTGRAEQQRVVAAGARYFGYRKTREVDPSNMDVSFPERSKLEGVKQFAFDMKHLFIDSAATQCEDIQDILEVFPADVIVSDPGLLGAVLVQEVTSVPVVTMGISPIVLTSVDTAPFGFGIHPSSSMLGRLRNRALTWFVQSVVFGDVQKHWTEVRARLGLPPTEWFMDTLAHSAAYLHPGVPGFEYPRSYLAANVSFIGMMPPERPLDPKLPSWWADLDGSRPVVHVTQGTIANAKADLFAPALEALENEDVLVVVSTGNRSLKELGLNRVPANARVAPFLSYPDLLPKTSVMLTNGGYGGVQMALAYGIPVIAGGRTEDKPEVSARVAWSGAGIDLKSSNPKPSAVRAAVRAVLDDPRYRARARELAAEYATYDALSRAVEAVERHARRRQITHARTQASALPDYSPMPMP